MVEAGVSIIEPWWGAGRERGAGAESAALANPYPSYTSAFRFTNGNINHGDVYATTRATISFNPRSAGTSTRPSARAPYGQGYDGADAANALFSRSSSRALLLAPSSSSSFPPDCTARALRGLCWCSTPMEESTDTEALHDGRHGRTQAAAHVVVGTQADVTSVRSRSTPRFCSRASTATTLRCCHARDRPRARPLASGHRFRGVAVRIFTAHSQVSPCTMRWLPGVLGIRRPAASRGRASLPSMPMLMWRSITPGHGEEQPT